MDFNDFVSAPSVPSQEAIGPKLAGTCESGGFAGAEIKRDERGIVAGVIGIKNGVGVGRPVWFDAEAIHGRYGSEGEIGQGNFVDASQFAGIVATGNAEGHRDRAIVGRK